MTIILFPVLFFFTAISQQKISFRNFDTKDGLSHQQVNCLFQDSRGFIWIGTNYGLNFYDGIKFTPFYHIQGDTNSLPHNIILSITEDKHHRLWIGTQRGICRFDFMNRQFTGYSYRNKGPYYLNVENCYVFLDKDEKVWIGHNKGLSQLDPAVNRLQHYTVQLTPPGQFRNPFITGFLEDSNADLWISTSYGVYQKKRNEETMIPVKFTDDYFNKGVVPATTKLVADRLGNIYCGSWGSGLFILDKNSNRFRQLLMSSKSGKQENNVFDITFNDTTVFIATEAGLLISHIDSMTGKKILKFEQVKQEAENLHSLPSESIAAAITDRNSDLWIATTKGFSRMVKPSEFITPLSYKNINGWITLSAEPAFDQKKLFLLTGLDLIEYSFENKKFTVNPFTVKGKFCSRLLKGKNNYWITSKEGLYRFDRNMQSPQLLTNPDMPEDAKGFNSLFEDSDGVLWLGAAGRKGMVTYDPRQNNWSQYLGNDDEPVNLSGKTIEAITEDNSRNIWIASNPVIRYNRLHKQFEKITIRVPGINADELNSASSVYTDKKGNVWIGTYAGLNRYNTGTQTCTFIPVPAGISPRINGITEDAENNLWLSTQTGLVTYNIFTNTFKLFNKQKGLPENDISGMISTQPDGKIVISYDGGISFIDAKLNASQKIVPQPQWTGIQVDNHPLPAEARNKIISLRHNQSISFSFISPDFINTSQNQYAYILDGIDKNWNIIGNNTSQRFANLPAGKYNFKVKAADSDGNWNEVPAVFPFIVKPVFWKTWWFISFMIITMASIAYIFYRYRLKQSLAVEKMRTRIATDLHDDIGATLSSISFYSEAVKQKIKNKLPEAEPILEKMGETSRNMVGKMSDIVWAINPKSDAAGSLFKRMQSYAAELCQLKNVQLDVDYDNSIDKKSLDIERRKNIYLVFKEAVNNALKYSDCSTISIKLETKQGHLKMIISDNGRGFNPEKTRGGNGLENMKRRAGELNGTLTITTAENKGTGIELHCPLP